MEHRAACIQDMLSNSSGAYVQVLQQRAKLLAKTSNRNESAATKERELTEFSQRNHAQDHRRNETAKLQSQPATAEQCHPHPPPALRTPPTGVQQQNDAAPDHSLLQCVAVGPETHQESQANQYQHTSKPEQELFGRRMRHECSRITRKSRRPHASPHHSEPGTPRE